ncbi:MAG: gamma-glutamyltransferase [Desulfobacterales bacterium]|nr:gamma-glutamyltransferase [Desulfobacterales bacterium]
MNESYKVYTESNERSVNLKHSFPSRRSAVMSKNGIVATSQPLAAQAGVSILLQGGNAIDAAIATAAALNVVEPMSTGLGGDAFALVYLSKSNELKALNASGRAPYAASLETFRNIGYQEMPEMGIHAVTIPGALDGWCSLLDKYGTMSLAQVLAPAIELAENGFPVTEIIGHSWKKSIAKLQSNASAARTYLIDGRAPELGEIFKQPDLARTFKRIAMGGHDVFYKGEIAEAIAACSQENGGLITMRDLNAHTSTWVTPISTNYRGYDVYECPPNGQGLVALLALNILEGYDLQSLRHNSPDYLHLLIEAMKLAFADADKYVADPDFVDIPLEGLLSKSYAEQRRRLIDTNKARQTVEAGIPDIEGDTVYLAVTDKEGNSVSFINSLYNGFGSGIVVEGTGICLQNRGSLFSLEAGHPNCIEPHKRPYHTIIPAMVFKDSNLFLTFGVMGGFMQPQGHVQVLLNIVDFSMDVQTALDAPRFRYIQGSGCAFEPGIPSSVLQELTNRGHRVVELDDPYSQEFGGGQAIMVHPSAKTLIAGSDPRKDGCAIGVW